MDDRKKRIDELERAKQESGASLDALLENFGENLYTRTKDMQVDFEDIILYNVYLKDIAESNSAIGKVEEKNRRFRELEETIEVKEEEEKERSKELEGIHRRLGKALLENSAYDDFTSLFREQADALSSKLESLESRIKELENKDGGNVFSWIGKSAQGLVLRSFLSKAQESQEQLYLNIGERYSDRETSGDKEEVASLRGEIEKIRAVSRTAMEELMVLRDEKRMISAGFGIDGNPQKQIQNLKNHIGQIREGLRSLYKNFGAQACGVMDAQIVPERKYFIDTIVTAEDGEIIGRAVRLSQSISDYDRAIGKLKASLAIDEENSKIEKYRRSIEEKNNRIIEFEKAIADLQDCVRESEVKIQELQKQL
jgi:tetratricopeptide (TPR) repeat protein